MRGFTSPPSVSFKTGVTKLCALVVATSATGEYKAQIENHFRLANCTGSKTTTSAFLALYFIVMLFRSETPNIFQQGSVTSAASKTSKATVVIDEQPVP